MASSFSLSRASADAAYGVDQVGSSVYLDFRSLQYLHAVAIRAHQNHAKLGTPLEDRQPSGRIGQTGSLVQHDDVGLYVVDLLDQCAGLIVGAGDDLQIRLTRQKVSNSRAQQKPLPQDQNPQIIHSRAFHEWYREPATHTSRMVVPLTTIMQHRRGAVYGAT